MSPRRLLPGVVATLLTVSLVCSLAVTAPSVAAQPTSVVVTNATTTPTTPGAGDTFSVRVTVTNQAGATGPFRFNSVAVDVPGSGPSGGSNARDLGTLSPGSSIQVELSARVDEPGWHQLRVRVNGQTSTGRAVQVTYPVTVQVVQRQRPQLDVDLEDGVVGAESTANVTVANGLTDSIRSLRLELSGNDVRVDRPSRVRSTLASEAETNYTFGVTPTSPGDRRLTARLTYTDASGEQRTVTEQFGFTVEPLSREVRLDVTAVRESSPAVEVTLVNLGNAPLEEVAVSGDSGDASLSTALVDRVAPRASETVRLNVTDLAAVGSTLTVRADYEVAGERHETARTVSGVFVPGRVDLTGIDVTSTGDGSVRITGTASNVGTTRVEATTVRVQSTESVTPANPAKEYFVGSIDASDFASFTVNARVDGESEATIPLEVTYLVDGEEQSRTVEATYDPPETPDSGGTGFPLVGVGVVLVVAVAGVVLWRRQRAA